MMRHLKNDLKLDACCIKRAAECGVSCDQFLKSSSSHDIMFSAGASFNVRLVGHSNEG